MIIIKKRIISVVLSLCVLISVFIPFNAYAYNDWVTIKSLRSGFHFCINDDTTCYGVDEKATDGYYNLPITFHNSSFDQTKTNVTSVTFTIDCYKACELYDGDYLEFEIITAKNRFRSFDLSVNFDGVLSPATITYDRDDNGKITGRAKCTNDTKSGEPIGFKLTNIVVDNSYSGFAYHIEKIRVRSLPGKDVETSGFFENVKNWFSTVFGWLKDIRDSISNGLTNLSNSIKGFFTDLSNNIKTWFTELQNKLKTWFDNIGTWITNLSNSIKGFFQSLGDRISGFFTTLYNWLWWGNPDGEASYTKPSINNKLNDIISKLNEYTTKLSDTTVQIDNSASSVTSYLSHGTEFVNGVMKAFTGLSVLISFAVLFMLVRKVVGR